jgi:hypothetical protein
MDVALAARALAHLPRRAKRQWSGWIGDIRSYRDMAYQVYCVMPKTANCQTHVNEFLWAGRHVPTGWEFYCLQSALEAFSSPQLQTFLKAMMQSSHFCTRPYSV